MLPLPPEQPGRAPSHQGTVALELAIPWLLEKQNTLQKGQQIGVGGFGHVHRGTWQGNDVAIKYFDIHGPLERAVTDFMGELTIMKDLEHPQIVQCLRHVCIKHLTIPMSCRAILRSSMVQ
eukprot:353397-Chlamydomonas_euryale.AAC.2